MISYFCFLPLFLMRPATENLCVTKSATRKKLDTQKTYKKKFWTNENPREKFLDPPNSNEKKFWNHKIPTRKRWD